MSEKNDQILNILRFIASGLLKWQKSLEYYKSVYPYPDELRIGLDRLAAYCVEKEICYPTDVVSALKLFNIPLNQWEGFNHGYFGNDESLLVDGNPSDICYELAVNARDVEAELTEQLILKVLNLCISEGRQNDYIIFRRQIIENPVMTKSDVISWSLDKGNCCAAELLKEAYEDLPPSSLHNGKYYTCGYCGWSIEWRNGIARCDSPICVENTDNFRAIDELRIIPENACRLKRGILRYVARPGLYELKLEKELKRLGLRVEMWPNFDAYDLKIVFPDGEVWAIDVKDWSNPYLLAKNAGEFTSDPAWNLAYFVVPQYRNKYCFDYKKIFDNEYYGSQKVGLEMDKDFIIKVKKRLKRGKCI